MTSTVSVVITAITHQGLVRPHNEDTVCVGEWNCSTSMDTPYQVAGSLDNPMVCIVADGMGGHAEGEVASQLAARNLSEQAPSCGDDRELKASIRQTNRKIYEAANNSPECQGMGSTVVGIILRNSGHILFNVGDSRLYRIKGGFLRQLSIDDVRVAQTELHHEWDPARSSGVITQCLGGAPSFTEIDPHVGTEPFVPEWRYLLCSDGLTDMVSVEEIESFLSADDEMTVIALLQAALGGGGHDNISIILISLKGQLDDMGVSQRGP